MKYMLRSLIAIAAITALHACEPMASNTANIKRLQDTLFTLYPTVNRVTVEVRGETELIVTLGDEELYGQPEATQQQTVAEIGRLSAFVFSSNEHLKKGSLILVAEEEQLTAAGEGKTYPFNF